MSNPNSQRVNASFILYPIKWKVEQKRMETVPVPNRQSNYRVMIPDYLKVPHMGRKNQLIKQRHLQTLWQYERNEGDIRISSRMSMQSKPKTNQVRKRLFLSVNNCKRAKLSAINSVIQGWE